MLTTRRQALTLAAAAIASTALSRLPATAADAPPAGGAAPAGPSGPFTLPPLPYGYDALEPVIDTETMTLHHDKHHAAYVKKLNEAVAKEPSLAKFANVDDLLKQLDSVPESIRTAVRNNGGGHANHSLFWETLRPASSNNSPVQEPSGAFAEALKTDVGGLDKLKEDMNKAGAGLFGSGWVWLVLDGGKKLNIITLPNQDSPLMEGHFPVFGIDVWEHAYYLKYHNVRADYLSKIWSVINWHFISDRYNKAIAA